THADLEKIQYSVLKALESPSGQVRKAAAECLASFLVDAYSADAPGLDAKTNKRNSRARKTASIIADDDIPERPMSPGPKNSSKAAYQITFEEALKHISAIYTKASTSTKVRAGLALTYIELITQ